MSEQHDKRRLLYDPANSSLPSESRMQRYSEWLGAVYADSFSGYPALWRWSVQQPARFWLSIAGYFGFDLGEDFNDQGVPESMPGGRWFSGATANFAAAALQRDDSEAAIIYRREDGAERELSWRELQQQVAACAGALKALGVGQGDRVVAYLPNVPEAVVAFLACARLGAIWSMCSPDFGARIVLDRFQQIEPRLLIAASHYRYGGKEHDRTAVIDEIAGSIDSLEHVLHVGDGEIAPGYGGVAASGWAQRCADASPVANNAVLDFNHPLWVVYTSGTTGMPKPIVHSHGGAMLELAKFDGLHLDLGERDRFLWYSSTGWIMWNIQIGGLLVGSAIAIYDGNPAYPDQNALWQFVADKQLTYFGAGAPLFQAAQAAGLTPAKDFDLSALKAVGSTGSPLPTATFEWLADEVKANMPIDSICGGTDVATAILGPCRLLPLYAGELQCSCLGAQLAAYDSNARPVVGELGELVIETPMPSMPLQFWNDDNDARYRAAYFERFDGVWSQGDWVRFLADGACIVYGRSDATLNRGGIRLGTSDFYAVVEALDWVQDSLVVDTSELGRDGELILFLKTGDGQPLNEIDTRELNAALTSALSPRHKPDRIVVLPEIPRTLTGKKLEVPVKKILNGAAVADAANPQAVDHPQVLEMIAELAAD